MSVIKGNLSIVNSLIDTSPNKALSALKGKELNDRINSAEVLIAGLGSGTDDGANYFSVGRKADTDQDTAAWTVYNDLAGNNYPITGTNTTIAPTIVWSRNNTNGLNSAGETSFDFRLNKTGGHNQSGQGVSVPFSIQNRHLSKMLQVSFDYEVPLDAPIGIPNGTFLISLIQDPENLNNRKGYIEPVNSVIQTTLIGSKVRHTATFQTHPDEKNYRFCIHITDASSTPMVVDFNNFRIWEASQFYGIIVTPWQNYTTTFTGLGTPTNVNLKWRRVGENCEIVGKWTNGTVTAVNASFEAPLGIKALGESIVGHFGSQSSSADKPLASVDGTGTIRFCADNWTQSLQGTALVTAGVTTVGVSFQVAGWQTNLVMTNDYGQGSTVNGLYYGNTGASHTANVTSVKFNNKRYDSHNAYNPTTGVFIVPFDGNYRFEINTFVATAVMYLKLFVNGVARDENIGYSQANVPENFGITVPNLTIGTLVEFRSTTTVTTTTATFSSFSFICNSAVNQTVAHTESVSCSYYSSAGQTALTGQINFGAKVFDTHNAVTTGIGLWKFVAPTKGRYKVSAHLFGTANIRIILYKSGVIYTFEFGYTDSNGRSSSDITLELNTGEFIDLRPASSATINGGTIGSGSVSRIDITRLGY